jgi:glycosyltransferase involved in cell wall biosynthesis
MKILLLAPHPFYQDRGTPIAVDLLIKTLSERGDEIDVLTYGEGEDVVYPRVTIRRTPGFIRGIRPGFSLKKVVSDFMMTGIAMGMVVRKRYDVVHAVEESAFIAILLQVLFRLPYVYDMDSSLVQQMVEKMPALKPLGRLMRFAEGWAVRRSTAVVPVCQALVDMARAYDQQKKICLLHDVVNIGDIPPETGVENLRDYTGMAGLILLYVGNLESYQGIDLLLQSFVLTHLALGATSAHLVIIGGMQADIVTYRAKSERLGIDKAVHFLGPKPLRHLSGYLRQADILLSPRIKGNNTPMKIYAYLQSGKPVLATDIYSHTQVLDASVAQLAPPTPEPFATALIRLINDPLLRTTLGIAGQKRVLETYSYAAYRQTLYALYGELEMDSATKKHTSLLGEDE